MNKPTQEQIKEFWEWCGFKESKTRGIWWYPAGGASCDGLPPIDLNNLFKYAVPKLQLQGIQVNLIAHEHTGFLCYLTDVVHSNAAFVKIEDKDPALALFWAIWEVIHEKDRG